MQLDQAPVELRRDFEPNDSHTIVEHLVWRLIVQRELIAAELIKLLLDLRVHQS